MRHIRPFIIAVLMTLPGIAMRVLHPEISPILMAFLTGMAILGASFILMWACDVAQMDMPQTLAVAVLALVAVLPEYAVDMYFTWMAGQQPESAYSHYAIANMTGANRLLIGVGWSTIVLVFAWRQHKAVALTEDHRTDIIFLLFATVYALFIPVKGSLEWYDGLVLLAIYIWYLSIIARRPVEEVETEGGVAEVLCALPKTQRRRVTLGLFTFAALVILADAELFSESLVATGSILGINEFLLVQWLAPIASEAPEFIVAIMFAMRGLPNIALGSLLSSKLNQWTLLVGMIPAVYGISSGQFSTPIPLDNHQLNEILLTAAQSLLAVCLLMDLRLSIREAVVLLVLFLAQFAAPLYQSMLEDLMGLEHQVDRLHFMYSMVYLALSAALIFRAPQKLLRLRYGLRVSGQPD